MEARESRVRLASEQQPELHSFALQTRAPSAAHREATLAEMCSQAARGGSPKEGVRSLEEIRAEMEQRARETRQLQAEVEHATQLALERMGRSLGTAPRTTPPPRGEDGPEDGPSREVIPAAAHSTQPLAFTLARCPPEHEERPPLRDATDTTPERFSPQASALQRQLSKTHELHEQQKILLRSILVKLQTQLRVGRPERDAMADRRQAHQLEKLLSQQEAESHGLLETEAQVEALRSKSEALEQTLQKAGAVLSVCEKCRHVAPSTPLGPSGVSQPSLGVGMEMALRDLEAENGRLRAELQHLEQELEAERRAKEQAKRESVEQTDRVEPPSVGHHQDTTVLREKLRSSQATASSLQAQLQLVRKQAETRASAVQRQLGNLERSLSALRSPMLQAQHAHLPQNLQEALAHAEALGAEGEELRKKLQSKECEVEGLEVKRRQLGDELQEHKLQVQHLKLSLEHQESRTRDLEQQLTEKTHELEVQRTWLARLADEQAALRQHFGAQRAELEGANSRLRAQLDRAESTLRTLEGADGHGLKVALYMQKEITAKREQIDVLQGRVQLQQESLDKMSQEKQAQCAELQATRQRLSSMSAERRRLTAELHALRSLEKQLREKTDALQAALDKMSKRLAECEGQAQQREQEIFRLKIHHTLHLRELEGQKCCTALPKQDALLAGSAPPYGLAEAEREPCVTSDSTMPVGKLLLAAMTQNPDIDLGSLVQELCGINEEDKGHEPPPERPHPLVQHTGCRTTSGSFTCTLESQHQDSPHHHPVQVSTAVSSPCASLAHVSSSSSSCVLELHLGCRSPVSSLLMSSPVSTSDVHLVPQ